MKKQSIKVLLSGGSFSGNKGAEAMYDSVIDELSTYYDDIDVTVLSKYPEDDKMGCAERGYSIVSYSTIEQLIYGGAFFLLGGVLKKLHLPYKWMVGKRTREFFNNDVMIDASGIAFTDDRSFVNVLINSLWFLPALISEIPIVKVSQTLGPYNKCYVKMLSKIVLSRISLIVCRGKRSYDYTKGFLKRENIYNLPDVAFCLKPCDSVGTDRLLKKYDLEKEKYIAVGPSFVLRDFMGSQAYSDILTKGINELSEKTDMRIVFVPHSWKHCERIGVDSVNDDISVCRDVAGRLNKGIDFLIISDEMNAHQFKSIIGNSYMAIGSRFHFLIAAISSGVPATALGWSHKYHELFREFDLEEYVLRYEDMNEKNVSDMICKLFDNIKQVKKQINDQLPDVIKRSKMNERLVVDYLEGIK